VRHTRTHHQPAHHPDRTARHPAIQYYLEQRAHDWQTWLADVITAFAGSMPFVYVHATGFTLWMLLIEGSPWPTLTLVVSLEAIFLSAFVMIGQNRQAALQQAKADHDFVAEELELRTNTQLTRQIHVLTTELHQRLMRSWTDDPEATPHGRVHVRPDRLS
jgi:uncharacterized membrane protein